MVLRVDTVTRINATQVRLSTQPTILGNNYDVQVSNVQNLGGDVIDPAHDTAAWVGPVSKVSNHATLPTGLLFYSGLEANCNDSTINAMHGTLHGSSSFVAGKVANCVSFSANGDYYLPQNAIFDTDYLTVSCWMNIASVVEWAGVVTKATNNGNPSNADKHCWGIRLNSAATKTITFSTVVGVTYDETLDVVQYSTGGWYHIVGTYDGTNAKLYVNGNNVAITARAGVLNKQTNLPIFVGTRCADSSPPGFTTSPLAAERINGMIDEVAIWDRAITYDEVHYLYNSGSGRAY